VLDPAVRALIRPQQAGLGDELLGHAASRARDTER
jgi:hypothetical protein